MSKEHVHAGSHGNHGSTWSSHAGVRRIASSLALAILILVAEAIGGWVSGSLALLSDAGHMLTDAAALALSLMAAVWSSRPADPKRTFGFRRLEVLAAQVNALTLFA